MNFEIILSKFNENAVQTRRIICESYEINRNAQEACLDIYDGDFVKPKVRFIGNCGDGYHGITIRERNHSDNPIVEEWSAQPPKPTLEQQELDALHDQYKAKENPFREAAADELGADPAYFNDSDAPYDKNEIDALYEAEEKAKAEVMEMAWLRKEREKAQQMMIELDKKMALINDNAARAQ